MSGFDKNKAAPARFTPTPAEGLSEAQVAERKKDGLTNRLPRSTAKPTWRIFFDNICTYFNLIWAVIIGTILYLGEYDQLFFVAVIFANTAIAIILELRAKYTLEKLNLVTAPQLSCVRGGNTVLIPADALVLDDVLFLQSGAQIPADCILLSGMVEMNESLLTGESDAIKKKPGDTLLAGSFIISGACHARVDRVGADSYIQTVARQVKRFKAPQSYLFRDIRRIVKWIGIAIIPFSVLMYGNNFHASGDVRTALLKTAGALEGMIPAGMFLLITVALSIGVVKLARRRTQVRDTYSIEMLARTDMLCLDKTGTITDGTMRVIDLLPLADADRATCENIIASIVAIQDTSNFTSDALMDAFSVKEPLSVQHNIPFSSRRKFTATVFSGVGTCAIGAPEFLSVGNLSEDVEKEIAERAANGQRVLMLAASRTETEDDTLPQGMHPLALIALEDHIRPEAKDTISWFVQNGVGIRIISGDNPVTVAAIARRVGVQGAEAYISLEGMSEEEVTAAADRYTVFGRVSPEQKLLLVRKLRALGYVVSMTGDGVNDTMALKEADCSIAMADGSEVARSLSNIVLLDNNFSTLPDVVREGRQVVNNVQRSSTLFLMKTFFTITLSLFCIIAGVTYPFEPNCLFMLEVFITGFPSVLLTLQKNHNPIGERFIIGVLRQCIPDGLVLLFSVLLGMGAATLFGFSADARLSLLVLALTFAALANLVFLCCPFNRIRVICVAMAAAGVLGTLLVAGERFGVRDYSLPVLLLTTVLVAVSVPLHLFLSFAYRRLFHRRRA